MYKINLQKLIRFLKNILEFKFVKISYFQVS